MCVTDRFRPSPLDLHYTQEELVSAWAFANSFGLHTLGKRTSPAWLLWMGMLWEIKLPLRMGLSVAHLDILLAGHVRQPPVFIVFLRRLLTCSLLEPCRGLVENAGLPLPWGLSRAVTEMLIISVSLTESEVTGCPCLHLLCDAGSQCHEKQPYSVVPWTHILNVQHYTPNPFLLSAEDTVSSEGAAFGAIPHPAHNTENQVTDPLTAFKNS